MEQRAFVSPNDAKYAREIRTAIDNKTLRYVLVQATENAGKYAGAELEALQDFLRRTRWPQSFPGTHFPRGTREAGLAVLQENAQQLIHGLEEGSTNPGDALSTTLTLAEAHCLMDPRAAIFPTWDAWVDAMQIGSALFAAATTAESHVRCRIAHKDRTLPAGGSQWYVNPSTWLDAFYLAVVCREKDRITALCHVPMSLLRENGSRFEEHHYAWIETLRKLLARGAGSRPEIGLRDRRTDRNRSPIQRP